MIYIGFFAVVFMIFLLILAALSEEEGLADIADRHTVNKLADGSRQRKPAVRRSGKYSKAGIQ